MRLLYLMTEPFGVGGVQSDILALTEDLCAKGHEVYVATTPGVLLDELKSRGARFVHLDFRYSGPLGVWKAGRQLRGIIREHDIEVLAPQSVRTTIAAWASLRLLPFGYRAPSTGKRLPIVTTIHNIHNPVHFRYAGMILNNCADFVIFESHYERNRCMASGLSSERSTVVHSGIDTGRFKPLPPAADLYNKYNLEPSRHRIFGIVARLSEEKGHNYLLEAFARVQQSDPDTRVLVIGDGPLLEPTQQLAKSLNLDRTVIFTGLQRNIPEHLSILDVFVLSSTRESFPLAAREAMAAGKPVIAPRIGGCGEVVDDNHTGYLFESRDIEQLAECMRKITESERHIQFGEAARQRVEDLFSRNQWVDGDERIYCQFLKR
jgi:glycosyltransferase involved in cell wall biosynthesis